MHSKTTPATVKVSHSKRLFFTLSCSFFFFTGFAQSGYLLHPEQAPPVKSIRGLSVVNHNLIWVAGTEGKVGHTSGQQGIEWEWTQVPGYDTCDWRSLVAFSDQRALVLNAGEPAHIMLTEDGGKSWKEVYSNHTKGIFFDAMAFKNAAEGIAIGDPIDGKFTIIRTKDSGKTWQADPPARLPEAKEGEAIFAASNTSLRILPDGQACFVTGGKHSRFFKGWDKWKATNWDFIQGEAGQGAFSVAFADHLNGVAVGGDYTRDTLTTRNCLITKDGGRSWQASVTPPSGYRSCVQHISGKIYVATGTSGTDISEDGGINWTRISKEGYHVAGVDRTLVWLAGSKKLGMFSIRQK
ncbi:beta propeller repeat protein [Chitinophaga rhizophila]|uniref:Oxidoreductase n=1 Tax=Chitinophaga rhizophila TaxID=2866212 RepID=A0ABS7GM90_9BACT|nr:oxidoreductase [Chitinophaga rhizophila]MBW8687718.1 oxidoreductase [Chitinophaga rhizophila]